MGSECVDQVLPLNLGPYEVDIVKCVIFKYRYMIKAHIVILLSSIFLGPIPHQSLSQDGFDHVIIVATADKEFQL